MTTTEMLALMKQRTKVGDQEKLLNELRSAYRWVVRRVYNSADGPDLLMTIGEELPAFVAITRNYDLGANVVGGEFLGLKNLWLRLPGDVKFTPLLFRDENDDAFLAWDFSLAATPLLAISHPVFYTVINFSKLRFAPALPIGSILRADYFRIGPVPDPTTNDTQENGVDLPAQFHDAMVHKATAQLFGTLDDSREKSEEARARDVITDAIYATGKRVQFPTRVQGYGRRRRR